MSHNLKHELEGDLLDEAVALALGWEKISGYWWEPGTIEKDGGLVMPNGTAGQCLRRVHPYSTDYAYGGDIIERYRISIVGAYFDKTWDAAVDAYIDMDGELSSKHGMEAESYDAPTALIAAMRALVGFHQIYKVIKKNRG